MANAGPSSSSGPTLFALQRALEEVSSSIASFNKAHLAWCRYHQACLPIVGNAWNDYHSELASHLGSIRGLRALRSAVQKELQWVERHSKEVGDQTVFTSSNSFFLSTIWQQVLYSALHQSPIIELDSFMPTVAVKKSIKSVKVDIVCQGGRRWVRHSTIKPLSLLSEFRNAESYVVDEGDSSDGGRVVHKDEKEHPDQLSLESIKTQLANGQVDGIASQCSLMKMARDLQAAANIAQTVNEWGRPIIEIVLTRLSLQDMTSSLKGKFYNEDEESRYVARLCAMVKEMEQMGLKVMFKESRQLYDQENQRRYLPSSVSSGETQDYVQTITPLPQLLDPPLVKSPSLTTTLNLDLSALVALVSQITHLPLAEFTTVEDADKRFLKHHWKTGASLSGQTGFDEDDDSNSHKYQGSQHNRALKDQLRREMTDDSFLEAILTSLQDGQKMNLVCTKEAKEKFIEILSLVGGPTEQRRAKHLFDVSGQEEFWRGSKWEHNQRAREKIILPVQSVEFSPASEMSDSIDISTEDEFQRLAKKSIRMGLCELAEPAGHAISTGGSSSSNNTGTGIQRQTSHTLASILYGLSHNCTTLTTNIASIKWLARDISRQELLEGRAKGYIESRWTASSASAVLFYPRSLAEKMMTSTYLPTSTNEPAIPIDWAGSTANDEYHPMMNTRNDSYADAKVSGANSYEGKTPMAASDILAVAAPLSFSISSGSEGIVRRCYTATKHWIRGPRPRSVLRIRHFKWWPLRPVEGFWLRSTYSLRWKDYASVSNSDDDDDDDDDVEGQQDRTSTPIQRNNPDEHDADAWLRGVKQDWKLNRLHWIALLLTIIGWAFAFTFIVKDLWYDASVVNEDGSKSSPSFYDCTTTYWLGNAQCGIDGQNCAPFSYPTAVPFRCPANCQTTTLGGTRAIGDQLPSFETLVIGGGLQSNSTSVTTTIPATTALQGSTDPFIYRGDSFVCSAAIHAGVLPREKGGCSSLWLTGAYSGYQGINRNGIQSVPFNSSFPVSFYFDSSVRGEKCTDRRYRGYILDVVLLAWTGFVLQPKNIVYYFTLVTLGFWHINFISEPREYPMSVGDPMGDFLPALFIAYAYWRLVFRYLWPAFNSLPLERNVWIQGFYWLGVLLDVVFVNVPLSRLVLSDITSQPGALTSLIVIIIVVVILAINQVRVIRKVGKLSKYLTLSIVGGIIIGLLAAIPTTGLRLHHYIIAMVLLLYCSFTTRLSLIYSAFLLGMFLNGAARWGFDGIIQDVSVIVGSGLTGSSTPTFLPSSNWTGVNNYGRGEVQNSTSLVHWQEIPSNLTDEYDSFQLLIDDVLRLQSSQTFFNLSLLSQYYLNTLPFTLDDNSSSGGGGSSSSGLASTLLPASNLTLYPIGNDSTQVLSLIASQPHYLRLAYYSSTTGNSGDFTKAATVWYNGTFISPESGST